MKLLLASLSPRRQELLSQVGLDFTVVASDFAEIAPGSLSPADHAKENACGKALAAARYAAPDAVVLAADTVVALDGVVFGKPKDAADAQNMLEKLSGRTHEVLTGFALAVRGKVFVDVVSTLVTMRHFTAGEIARYVATGEPLDKAGAYGIQGKGALLVQRIEGCYYNVVGLPLVAVFELLKKAGVYFED